MQNNRTTKRSLGYTHGNITIIGQTILNCGFKISTTKILFKLVHKRVSLVLCKRSYEELGLVARIRNLSLLEKGNNGLFKRSMHHLYIVCKQTHLCKFMPNCILCMELLRKLLKKDLVFPEIMIKRRSFHLHK